MKTLVRGGLLASLLVAGCGEDDGERRSPSFTDIGAGLPGLFRPSLAWGDYDSDGDLDLIVAGTDASYQDVCRVYRNDGAGVFVDIGAGLTDVFCERLAWGDYDSDGDLDLVVARSYDATSIYRNDGGAFTDIDAGLPMLWDSCVAWGDYDNDGDLDLALAGRDSLFEVTKVYRNDGGTFADSGAALDGAWLGSLAWGDYDNDGDLDLAVAGVAGGDVVTDVYRNDGGSLFTKVGAGLEAVTSSSLAWGDYDSDGDLDLAVAGHGSPAGVSKVYRNDGAGVFADVNAGLTGVSHCALAWGDYDNDGDLDLALAGGADSPDYEVTKVYRNDGGGVFTDAGAELTGVDSCSLAWGDYDNDGDLDLALAGYLYDGSGRWVTEVHRNNVGRDNSPPSAPCALGSTVLGTDVVLSWLPAEDAETPTAGLSYNLRVRDDSGGGVMPGMADDATGYRRIPALGNAQKRCFWILKGLAPGTYYWSVQAIDTAYAGSPWAPEQTVTVP